jgi:mRNA interferase RelE/StbE
MPKDVRSRILKKIEFYTQSGVTLRFAEALKDTAFGEFRFRIGDYRVIFDIDKKRKAIIVLAVGHRKDIYR